MIFSSFRAGIMQAYPLSGFCDCCVYAVAIEAATFVIDEQGLAIFRIT